MAQKRKAAPKIADARLKKLFLDKLESSGLTSTDAHALGITALTPTACAKLSKSLKPLAALRFDYYAPDGTPLADLPGSAPYYRIRYLDSPTGFAAATEKKPRSYTQLPGTQPTAYYPQNCADWPAICTDVTHPIIITEGELKAAKACKEGFPCIGLGGVDAFKSKKQGVDWLPSLDFVTWKKRRVYIAFDSDYRTNPHVCRALAALADELQAQGAYPYMIDLPDFGDGKVGLDDFMLQAKPDPREQFRELQDNATPINIARPLWRLNDTWVLVRDTLAVTNIDNPLLSHTGPEFKTLSDAATLSYLERTLKPDGSMVAKKVSAAETWLTWPHRHVVDTVTYSPGENKLVDEKGLSCINTWPGWGCESAKGDVSLFTELLDHLFQGAEARDRKWFEQWMAYPIQHPGAKMSSCVVIYGAAQGTGKTLLGLVLSTIYGDNFGTVDDDDLDDSFTEWAQAKSFIVGDDLTGSHKKSAADKMKRLITRERLKINIKNKRPYYVDDKINYLFTSNRSDVFRLDVDARRFFVHEVICAPLDMDFYRRYALWAKSAEGAGAVKHYFEAMNLAGFDRYAPAPVTVSKERMTDNTGTTVEHWARELVSDPDAMLRVGEVAMKQDIFTAAELLALFRAEHPDNKMVEKHTITNALAALGIRSACGNKRVSARARDPRVVYYAIRNIEQWVTATPAKARTHLTKHNTFYKG